MKLIKDKEWIIVRQKVFGMKLKGRELVLGKELQKDDGVKLPYLRA